MDNKEYSVQMDSEKNIWLRTDDSKTMQRTDDGKPVLIQIRLQVSEIMPDNSTIYNNDLRVICGRVGLTLNDEQVAIYATGSVIHIPAKTKISLSNQHEGESMVLLVRT